MSSIVTVKITILLKSNVFYKILQQMIRRADKQVLTNKTKRT